MSSEAVRRVTTRTSDPNQSSTGGRPSQRTLEDDASRIWEDLPKKYRIKKRGAYIRRHNDFKIASNYRKFKLLLWKNYIVSKRRWGISLIQFCAPLFLVTILVIRHTNYNTPGYTTQISDAFKMDQLPKEAFNDCDTIYLFPEKPQTQKLIIHLKTRAREQESKLKFNYLKGIPLREPTPEDLCAVVEFNDSNWPKDNSDFPPVVNYSIRFPGVYHSANRKSPSTIGKQWDTFFFFPPLLVDGAREVHSHTGGHPKYHENGFLYLQHFLAMELIEVIMIQEGEKYNITDESQTKKEFINFQDKLSIQLRRFPFPGHESNDVTEILYNSLPTALVAGFAVSSFIMVFLSVRERMMGVRTLLKMYGVVNTYNKYTFVLHNWFFLTLSSLLITLILSVWTKWTTSLSGVYIISQKYLSEMFFVLLVCYTFNIVCTVTLLSCLFTSASTACVCVTLLGILTFIPYISFKQFITNLSFGETFLVPLFPHTALGLGLLAIADLQSKSDRKGWDWDNMFRVYHSLGWVYCSIVLTGIVQFLVALYVSRVFPEKGMPKLPWNFLFKGWYWYSQPPPSEEAPLEVTQEKSYEELHPEYFENDVDTKKRKELCIENLCKYYGRMQALHKVNCVCYQDYVTVLLGDKGSGKSVLLNIVNGTMVASKGTIYLSRKDLSKNPNMGKAFIGYCPTENLLFPDLTVDETLQFFTALKGLSNRIEAYEEVERFLKITTLVGFRDTMVCDLTQSSQRMLMVATAFVGGSRVVLLDDPTVNMSATQQRVLWDFTAQEKKHRTVIVALDKVHEVHSVADKLVLLNNGHVTARGSLDFLQQKFGGGYHLEIESLMFYDEREIDDLITRRIHGSVMQWKSWNGRHFEYYLPSSESAYFPGLLEELERYKLSYGIQRIKVRLSTLEELYLKLKRLQSDADEKTKYTGDDAHITSITLLKRAKKRGRDPLLANLPFPPPTFTHASKFTRWFREFSLMFLKNARYTLRNRGFSIISTITPLLMLMMFQLITLRIELPLDPQSHWLDPTNAKKGPRYCDPHIKTDMEEATNEGVHLRASVSEYFKKKHFKEDVITYEDSIIRKILAEHDIVENENNMSNLAIQIYKTGRHETHLRKNPANTSVANSKVKVGLTGYFNNQPLHTPAVALSLVHNILLHHTQKYMKRKLFKNHTFQNDYHLNVTNHPWTYQPADRIKHTEGLLGPGYLFGVFSSFAYSFHFPFFIILHVKEQDFRHLQMLCGANKFIFWFANYLWNMMHFSVVCIFHLIFLKLAGIPGFQHAAWDGAHLLVRMLVLLEMYGFTCINIVGCFASFHYKSWGKAFSKLALLFLITGPLLMLIIIPIRDGDNPLTFAILHNILLIFPGYAFGSGMYSIIANEAHNAECGNLTEYKKGHCDKNLFIHPFNEFSITESVFKACCFNRRDYFLSFIAYGIGRNFVCLVLVTVGCILLKRFFYSKKMREWQKKKLDTQVRRWHPVMLEEHEIKDYDVLAETAKVYGRISKPDNHRLTIRNLTYETRSCVKLDNICFEIIGGECFALLGTACAGKTTFLKTLCGYPGVMPTYGDVELHGTSLLKNYNEYMSCLSYCPDQNPFLDSLSGVETLELVGTLRRLTSDSIKQYIDHASEKFDMLVEMEQPIKKYNHVQTKKLSACAAFMGNFEVLLMDNPTSHLDSRSKQMIHANVRELMKQGCVVIWASDGIEHCDSICSKLSIMVNGHLKCFGSLDHLKDIYEKGFTIVVRFSLDKDLVYFTSKKNIWMENEVRETEIDDETGLPVGASKYEERKKNLMEALREDVDVEKALADLAPWEQDLCPFISYFERNFPVDKQPGFVHYHVHPGSSSWYELFTKMEEAKAVADVDSYYVCCTTLEQVFFNFSRGQKTIDLEN